MSALQQYFLQCILLLCFTSALYAKALPVQTQAFSQEVILKQRAEIASMAATALSKELPKKIDKYTTLLSIKSSGATLVYTFTINSSDKNDTVIQREDHSRMQKAIIEGVCQSSQRFLQAGINTAYIYKSAKTKKLLFRFDITKEKCKFNH